MSKVEQWIAAARSFLTTGVVVLGGLIALAAAVSDQLGVQIPASWIAWLTLAAALCRTGIAALDSAMPLFGRGAGTTPPGGGEGGASGGAGETVAGGEDVVTWDVDAEAPVTTEPQGD